MKPRSAPFLLFLSFLFMGLLAHSQQKTISGTVKNAQGTPISGASVLVKGTQSGTSTNDKGEFSIVAVEGNTLIISSIGFTATNVVVKGNTGYNIQLQDGSNPMNEVVVTALGIKKQKRELGFSVTEVKGSDLAKTNEVNPINALQGRVAGVQIDQGSGGLFGNSKIVIRGNSTLGNNNQPIFVVDGVIMENSTFNGTGRDFGNDLKNLNTEDFESVSILKGSSAAALYGTRAINGVVLITTKKGTKRRGIGISVAQSVNITDPYAGPRFQNEFGGGSVGAFFTDNRDPNYLPTQSWETKVFPTDPVTGKPYIDRQINRELENWGPRFAGQDVINYDGTPTKYVAVPNNFLNSFQTGVGSNTNVAMEGGSDKTTFRLSYNHNDAKGIVPNNTLKKDAFDLRITQDLAKWLHVDAGVSYSDFYGLNPPRNGGLDAFASDNYGKLFTWAVPRNYDTKYWNRPEKYISKLGGTPDPTNPTGQETVFAPEIRFWFQKAENKYSQREQQLRGRLTITADLTSWAKLVVEGNFLNINTKNESKELGQSADFVGGSYSLGFDTKYSKFFKAMLMMNKDITKDLSISGYIGVESQRQTYTNSTTSTSGGLLYPGNYSLTNSVKPVILSGGGSNPNLGPGVYYDKSFNSLYGSADLGYKNRLFMQVTFRSDWSSALRYLNGSGTPNFRYPAVSLSWVFTEGMKSLPSWLNYGKLRGNIANLGGDVDVYLLNPGFYLGGFSYANGNSVPVSTYSSSSTVQANVKPRNKLAKELGAEFRFFKDGRLGLDVSVYQDNTKNQIIPITTPTVSGVSSLLVNAGNLQNRGIEIALDYTAVKTKNFRWTTALNYSTNQNKVVKLYPGVTEYNLGADIGEISTWAVEGKSYGVMRTTIHSTTDAKTGLPILAWRSDARAAFPARSNVMQDVGNINSKFRAGWDNTFNYKNFSLNVLVDAKIGGDFALLTYRYGTHSGVFPNSIAGRDGQSGGIAFTSKYDNINYTDGRIVQGVFAAGQKITQPDGSQVDVGGMTFEDAYKKGYVEPTHTPQFFYRYGSASTGVSDFWVLKNSWVSLRQVALSYNFSKALVEKLKLNNLSLSIIGRDLLYIYQTLPYNYNPASNNSNNTAFSGEEGFLPKTRNITFTLRAGF